MRKKLWILGLAVLVLCFQGCGSPEKPVVETQPPVTLETPVIAEATEPETLPETEPATEPAVQPTESASLRLEAKAGNIVELDAGYSVVAVLRTDGTVAVADAYSGEAAEIYDWTDIVQISVGGYAVVGLRADGTVVASGEEYSGADQVTGWTDIVAVECCPGRILGIRSDGTVVSTDPNDAVSDWTEIVAVSASVDGIVYGVKADGTVVRTVPEYDRGVYDVSAWTGVVDISAGWTDLAAMKADGTAYVSYPWWKDVFGNPEMEVDYSGWYDIQKLDGMSEVLGLRADGTVVAAGPNEAGCGDVEDWCDIVDIAAGEYFSVGLKSDGTIIGTSEAYNCNFASLCG